MCQQIVSDISMSKYLKTDTGFQAHIIIKAMTDLNTGGINNLYVLHVSFNSDQ